MRLQSFKINQAQKADFHKNAGLEKNKGSRRGIVFLLFGTIILSFLFWFKNRAKDFINQLNQPTLYKINKKSQQDLEDFLEVKLDIKSLTGVKDAYDQLINNLRGSYGVYFYELKSNQWLGVNENEVFTAASVNKVPIIVSFYQAMELGKLKDAEYVLQAEDIQDYGAGSMRYKEPGSKYRYSQLVELSGKESDNTAAYVLVKIIGINVIQEALDKLKMSHTSINDNTTTPKEMGDYFVALYQNKLVSLEAKDKIFQVLTDTDFEDRIPKGLPSYVRVVHKVGNEVQIYNDCGLILSNNPYVLCILTNDVIEAEALTVIPKISRLFWEFTSQKN